MGCCMNCGRAKVKIVSLHLCENEFEPSCICWVGLQSESIKETPMFINRGKVKVGKEEE